MHGNTLRKPTYRIPLKIFNYHPEGKRDRSTTDEMDGSVRLTRSLEQAKRAKPCRRRRRRRCNIRNGLHQEPLGSDFRSTPASYSKSPRLMSRRQVILRRFVIFLITCRQIAVQHPSMPSVVQYSNYNLTLHSLS
jgi:hypothetical protein